MSGKADYRKYNDNSHSSGKYNKITMVNHRAIMKREFEQIVVIENNELIAIGMRAKKIPDNAS